MSCLLRLHSFWDFSGRRITGISIPTSTYSISNGTETTLFRNKVQSPSKTYHNYSSSSSYSTLWGGIDRIDGILFQFYLFPKNVTFNLLFFYSTSPIPKKPSKGMQPKLSWKYLIDHDSRCKNWISFIDIRNIMMLHGRKRWFWIYWFSTILQSTLQTGIENINGLLRNAKDWPGH